MFEVDEQVLENIKRTFTIPSRPEILFEIQELLKQPQPSLAQIAEIVAKDVGVAAGVLKVVNSAAFGLARTVTNIKQSAMFLGLDGMHSLVTGLVLKQSMNGNKCCISLDNFWDKASIIADVAVHIGKRFKGILVPEDIYTASLFQDCGIPAMALKFKDYNQVLDDSERSVNQTLAEIEESRYHTNHAIVGYFISSTWQLPRHICKQVLLHHDRTFLDDINIDNRLSNPEHVMFAVIKMAENIVSQQYNCHELAEWPNVKFHIFDLMDIDEDDYLDIIEDVEHILPR